ncbi:rhotekin-like isoform 2-T2 [Spinachia spinachia]
MYPGQDEEVLKRIEREVRMREGASKLLAACSRREQALEASKSLLTCNARILALLSQLQHMRRDQVLQRAGRRPSEDVPPCLGKVSLSDLRIPLMWKDSEYFKNKGELQRCAVFCLLQCGAEIHDTDLVMVDRTLTDICFEGTILFEQAAPSFQLRVELFSSSAAEEFSPAAAAAAPGPRRASCLGGSVGCSSGKKIRAAFESAAACGSSGGGIAGPGGASPPLSPALPPLGPKYHLLADTTLRIEHVQEGFKTHDLSLATTEDNPSWLPLYGSMCCRLAAQPVCMMHPITSGQLEVKLGEELSGCESVHAVLRGQSLLCYRHGEAREAEDEPVLVIPIQRDTTVTQSEADVVHCQTLHLGTRRQGERVTFALRAPTPEDTRRWNRAISRHVHDMNQWKQCSDGPMQIEAQSSKNVLPAKQRSLYHEIVTPSSPGEGHVVPDLSVEIRTLLSCYYKENY